MSKNNSSIRRIPKNIISILKIPPVGRRKKPYEGITIGELAKRAGCQHPLMRNILLGKQKVRVTKSQRALEVILAAVKEVRLAQKGR